MKHMDDELSDTEYAQLVSHTKECIHCRRELEDLKNITGILNIKEEIELPCELQDSVMQRVRSLDIYNKKIREKRLMAVYFVSAMVVSLVMIVLGTVFRDSILDMMINVGVPISVAHFLYGGLTRLAVEVQIAYETVIYFKSRASDFYYVLVGLAAITFMSKIYEINGMQSVKNNSRN
jgi:hypothetical protein